MTDLKEQVEPGSIADINGMHVKGYSYLLYDIEKKLFYYFKGSAEMGPFIREEIPTQRAHTAKLSTIIESGLSGFQEWQDLCHQRVLYDMGALKPHTGFSHALLEKGTTLKEVQAEHWNTDYPPFGKKPWPPGVHGFAVHLPSPEEAERIRAEFNRMVKRIPQRGD